MEVEEKKKNWSSVTFFAVSVSKLQSCVNSLFKNAVRQDGPHE